METQDSFQSRLEEAAKHLSIQPDKLKQTLADLGIEDSPDVLDVLANPEEIKLFGELRAALPEVKNIPLRLAINVLAGPKKKDHGGGQPDRLQAIQRALGLSKDNFRIDDVDPAALLKVYDPDRLNDPVTTALRKHFGDRRVVVFRGTGVAVDETIDYAVAVMKGMDEQPYVMVDGEPVEPVGVGVVPNSLMDEDPLFPGNALWGGRSRKNNIDYNGIEKNVRQYLRMLLNEGHIDVSKRLELSHLFAELKATNAPVQRLMDMFPETYIEFKKRSEEGKLPPLTVRMGELRKQNPFGNRRV